MPFYLYQMAYAPSATKALVDHPQNREEVAKVAVELLGGKLHAYFFSFGEYDVIAITEFPDNVTAGAASLATASTGAFSKFHTTPLLTTAESMKVMKKAQKASYRPPE